MFGEHIDYEIPQDLAHLALIISPIYKVIKLLGIGSSGVVFAVQHQRTGTEYAIKIVKPHIIPDYSLERFEFIVVEEMALCKKITEKQIPYVAEFYEYLACFELGFGMQLSKRYSSTLKCKGSSEFESLQLCKKLLTAIA